MLCSKFNMARSHTRRRCLKTSPVHSSNPVLYPSPDEPLLSPSSPPHTLLNARPQPLYDLPIPPPALLPLPCTPLVHAGSFDHASPSSDHLWYSFSVPAQVDAERMREQVRRVRPLVTLKLPCLASCEDRDDALPVIGLELVGCVDEDEAEGALGVDRGHET
jgi:hypothetical protein